MPKYQLLQCAMSCSGEDIRHFGSNIHYSALSPPSLYFEHGMTEATTFKERHFLPVEMFLDSARKFVAKIRAEDPPLWPDLMAAASLLSLSLEALVNSLGPLFVSDFSDFDSSSPVAKLRIIHEKVGLSFDKSRKPISDILELARFRNKVAHPKYKKLECISDRLPLHDAQALSSDESKTLHELERSISPEAVERWLEALLSVTVPLLEKLEPEHQWGHSRSWLKIHED